MLLRLSRSKAYDIENKVLYSITVDFPVSSRRIEDSMGVYFDVYRHNYDGTYDRIYREILASEVADPNPYDYSKIIDWIEEAYKRGDKVISIPNVIKICIDSAMNTML